MKKIALAALLTSGLMAADSCMYVGIDAGNTKASGDVSWSTGSENIDVDGTFITAKLDII